MSREQHVHLVLRIGAAFAFVYPPLRAIYDPVSWMSYFPHIVRTLPFDQLVILHGFGVIEIVLALWILSGWKIRIPAVLATSMLFAIVIFNAADFDVLFRDLSLAALTLALALWPNGTIASSLSRQN